MLEITMGYVKIVLHALRVIVHYLVILM